MKEDLAKAHDTMSTLMDAQEQPATSDPFTTEMIPSIRYPLWLLMLGL
jgi:hypothetical protein